MDTKAQRAHSEDALAVYAESLVAGRAVAVFGDASSGIVARLQAVGARTVHVWDPDPQRASIESERAPEAVSAASYASLPRFWSADVAIVPDLGSFDDSSSLVARLRDVVGRNGVVLAAAANRDSGAAVGSRSFEYYELFDRFAEHFSGVTMVAELAFRGVALVALGDEGEPAEVSIDTQLADGDRVPERFVVVASQSDVAAQPYTVVELPPESALVEEHDRQLVELNAAVERLRVEADESSRVLAGLQDAARRGDRAEAKVGELERALKEMSDSSAADRREVSRLTEANALEVRHFEETLRERGHLTRSLEAEVARRDQIVRELVDTVAEREAASVPDLSPSPPVPHVEELLEENGRLRGLLDAIALDVARREADARSASWAASELETQQRRQPPTPGDGGAA
jgi:hypothetical protein